MQICKPPHLITAQKKYYAYELAYPEPMDATVFSVGKGIPRMLQDIVNDSDIRNIPVKLLLLDAQKTLPRLRVLYVAIPAFFPPFGLLTKQA
jgi:hypothetical protein